MKGLVAFFRLVRPVNLLIIVFTMVAMRWGVIAELAHDFNPGTKLQMDHWKFVLSVLVMVLLAASGNIINDYFDLKVDRINKPEKVIVGKLVKRRVAMISHHALNALAVLIGFYLAWDSGMYWIGLVPIIMGTLLWFYSLKFKKAPWIGNFVVALMVAVVPLWAGVFEIPLLEQVVGIHSCMHFNPFVWFTLGGFSLFAFWLTLIREAIKDLEDLEGDSRAGFRTLPIVLGEHKMKNYLKTLFIFLFCGLPVLIFECTMNYEGIVQRYLFSILLFSCMLIPSIIAFNKVSTAEDKNAYSIASVCIKIVMIIGISLGFMV